MMYEDGQGKSNIPLTFSCRDKKIFTFAGSWEYKTKSSKILQIWWKKGNNSMMGNQIFFKIAG